MFNLQTIKLDLTFYTYGDQAICINFKPINPLDIKPGMPVIQITFDNSTRYVVGLYNCKINTASLRDFINYKCSFYGIIDSVLSQPPRYKKMDSILVNVALYGTYITSHIYNLKENSQITWGVGKKKSLLSNIVQANRNETIDPVLFVFVNANPTDNAYLISEEMMKSRNVFRVLLQDIENINNNVPGGVHVVLGNFNANYVNAVNELIANGISPLFNTIRMILAYYKYNKPLGIANKVDENIARITIRV